MRKLCYDRTAKEIKLRKEKQNTKTSGRTYFKIIHYNYQIIANYQVTSLTVLFITAQMLCIFA